MQLEPHIRIGEENINNQNENMKIIRYNGCMDIDVIFDNGNISTNKQYSNFLKGTIKNSKLINGAGYIGSGDYKSRIENIITPQYYYWSSMIMRCYQERSLNKRPTYNECTVCDDWLNYQNFAKWFDKNFYPIKDEKMCLDKDILVKGNKIYSPDMCIFVPNDINMMFVKSDARRGKYPIGVYKRKDTGKYSVSVNFNTPKGINKSFPTIEEAYLKYKTLKEDYIKSVANKYKNNIPQKLYDALCNYNVDITD